MNKLTKSHDHLLEIVLTTFFEAKNISAAMETVLRSLGKYFDVSRVYVFEDMGDGSWCSNTYEWCADGVVSQKESLHRLDYSTVGGKSVYIEQFGDTGVFCCPDISQLPDNFKGVLEHLNVQSFLQCAILDNGNFCGFIGFDDCCNPRSWNPNETGTLTTLSRIIAAILTRNRSGNHNEFSIDFQTVLDNDASYVYLIDPNTFEVLYSNLAIRKYCGNDLRGNLCHREFMNSSEPCATCPVRALRETGKSQAIEINRPDGMYLLAQASPLRWRGRNLMMISCTDITTHKAASEMLRIRGEEYSIVIQQSGKLVLRYNIKNNTAKCYFDPVELFGKSRYFRDKNTVVDPAHAMVRANVITMESAGEFLAFFRSMKKGIPSGSCNVRIRTPNGFRWSHADYTLVRDADGNPSHSIISFGDNTEQYEKELAFEKWQSSLSSLTAENALYLEVNLTQNRIDRWEGIDDDEIANNSLTNYVNYCTENKTCSEDKDMFREFFDRRRLIALYESGVFEDSLEFRVAFQPRKCLWYRADVQLIKTPYSGDIKGFVVFSDINEEKCRLEQLAQQAFRDSLTGLFNRDATETRIRDYLAMCDSSCVSALFMIDLDNFKQVNDTLGHQAGDTILKSTATAIAEVFRTDDVVGRLGGDEFMVFLPNCGSSDVIDIKAKAILEALQFDADGISITASIGVAICKGGEKTYDRLYSEADSALYRSKNRGKNSYMLSSGNSLCTPAPHPDDTSFTIQLKTLLEHMDGGVIMADTRGEGDIEIFYVSPSFYKSLGYPREEIRKKRQNIFSFVHPDDLSSVLDAINEAAESNQITDVIYRAIFGSMQWCHLRVTRLPGETVSGKVRVIGVISDVTEIKHSEQQLRFAEERYRLAMKQTGGIIIEVDIPARAMITAPEVSEAFGGKGTRFINIPESILDCNIIHPNSKAECIKFFNDVFSGQEGSDYTILAKDDKGEYVWTKISYSLIRDSNNEPYYAISVAKRLTNIDAELRAFEQELRFQKLVEDSLVGTVRVNLSKNDVEYLRFDGMPTEIKASLSTYDKMRTALRQFIFEKGTLSSYVDRLNPEFLFDAFRNGNNWIFSEFLRNSKDGVPRGSICAIYLLRHPASGDLYLFLYVRDINEQKQWETLLSHPVTSDITSMLYTAESFKAVTEAVLSSPGDPDKLCSLSCINVAGLDALAKEKGSRAASDLIFSINRLFRILVGGKAILGQFSDSRLVIFRMDTVSQEEQQRRVEQIREHILRALKELHSDFDVSLYFGFATEKRCRADFDSMLAKASLACTTAKKWMDNPVVGFLAQSETEISEIRSLSPSDNHSERRQILLVNSDASDRSIFRELVEPHYNVLETGSGQKGLSILLHEPGINLLVLGVNISDTDYLSVLDTLRRDKQISDVPVIVVTSDNTTEKIINALDHGAADVIPRPYNAKIVLSRVRNVISHSEAIQISNQNWDYEMRLQQQTKLLMAAERDDLTGLYNRQAFYRRVKKLIDSKPDTKYVMIRFDIDRFKVFNDALGSEQGDKLLQDIGKYVGSFEDLDHLCARITSDHFACFIPFKEGLVETLSQDLSNWLQNYPVQVKLSCSMGAYVVDDPLMEVNLMCDRALIAQQTIKNSYTRRFAFYDDTLRLRLLEEQSLTQDFSVAIKERQFVLYYQPLFDQVSGEIIGAETLVRWNHPKRGLIPPGQFIPLFEKNGLITQLDTYVWEEACAFMRRRLDVGEPMTPLSINISRKDFYNIDLCDFLCKLMEKYDLSPHMLRLELTETAYIDNPNQLSPIIAELRNNGFFVEMDDFGSGYSSLNTLKNVYVDLLKLDMRFLDAGGGDGRSGIILNSIISMANWLGLPVLAEGVETYRQSEYLRTVGCNLVQGFLFARPMPEKDFSAMLSGQKTPAKKDNISVVSYLDSKEFWTPESQTTVIFNSFIGPAGIFEYTPGQLLAVRLNDRFFHELGIPRGYFSYDGKDVMNCLLPEDSQAFLDMVNKASQTESEVICELRWCDKDQRDKLIWIRQRIRKMGLMGDKLLLFASVENITARKLIEENSRIQSSLLALENERSRIIMEFMGAVIFDYDYRNDTIIYTVNHPSHGHQRYSKEHYLDTIYNNTIVHPGYIDEYRKRILDASKEPTRGTFEFMANIYGKGYRWVQGHFATIADESGTVYRSLGICVDIQDDW